MGQKILKWISGGAVAAFFLLTLLAINFLQVLSLAVRPFSESWFRRINLGFAGLWWGWLVSWMEGIRGVQIDFYGDSLPPRENVILISNHQQMPDIPVLMALARRQGRLPDMKWFVKDPLKHVPGMGWGLRFLDCVFLKRSWNRDRAGIERTFARLRNAGVPFWMISFVEGTRIKPEKLARSQRYARERGWRVPRHVLIPRTKGFVACIHGLGDRADAIYDVTIAFHGGVPSLWQFFQGKTKKVSVDVRRFAMGDLPRSDEELENWLLRRFEFKDDLLELFDKEGHF